MGTWKKDKSGNWKKSSSSGKKNYTIVNGKKVEQTSSTKTAPSTSNETWNKDVVTLEEAKQQTKDVDRGIINVNTGATSLSDTPSSSISLVGAAEQSSTEKRKTAAELANSLLSSETTVSTVMDDKNVTQTTETVETHNDLSAIKVGGSVKSAAQMGKVTKKKTSIRSWANPFYTPRADLSNSKSTTIEKSLTPEQATRIAALMNAGNAPSGTGQGGSLVFKPGEKPKESIITAFASGVKTGGVSEETAARFSGILSQTGTSKKVYDSGIALAEKMRNVGNKGVNKGTELILAANKSNPLSLIPQNILESIAPTGNKFVKGAVVNTGAGLVTGAAGVPGAIEVAVKNPAALGGALIVGTGVMIGSTAKGLKDDPATTLGEIAGMYLLSKGSGKAVNKVSDEIRTRGRIEVPVETMARESVISGKSTFPTVPKGTPVNSVLADFKNTVNLHPEPTVLKKLGGDYGVHVSPGTIPKKAVTRVGTSETPGLYTGPDASLHFAGLDKTSYKLLGLAKDSEPGINFIQMSGQVRLPKSLRGNLKGANEFMVNKATKGKGYSSVKLEQGLKVGATEPELIIPPGTKLALNAEASGYFTRYKGRKMPVNVFESVKGTVKGRKTVSESVKVTEKSKVYRDSDYSGMNERIVLSDRDIAALGSRSKSVSSSKGKVSSSSMLSSLIKPSVPKSLSSSRKSSKSSDISSISSLKSSRSSSKSGSRGSSSGSGKSDSSGSSSGSGSGSGSGASYFGSSYPFTWKPSGGSNIPIVAVPGKTRKSKKSRKSTDTGVKHKMEFTGFKNIWEFV